MQHGIVNEAKVAEVMTQEPKEPRPTLLQQLAGPDDSSYLWHSEQLINRAIQEQMIVALMCIDVPEGSLRHNEASSILDLKTRLLTDHDLDEELISHTESGQIWCTLASNSFDEMFRAVVSIHLTVITATTPSGKGIERFVGVTLAPEHGRSLHELTRKTAIAVLQARQKPGKIRFFSA